jgi:hypothetical protein
MARPELAPEPAIRRWPMPAADRLIPHSLWSALRRLTREIRLCARSLRLNGITIDRQIWPFCAPPNAGRRDGDCLVIKVIEPVWTPAALLGNVLSAGEVYSVASGRG